MKESGRRIVNRWTRRQTFGPLRPLALVALAMSVTGCSGPEDGNLPATATAVVLASATAPVATTAVATPTTRPAVPSPPATGESNAQMCAPSQ